MTSPHRPRRIVLETLTESSKSVRSRAYRVIRGAINWSTWPWEDHSKGIAIVQDQGNLFPSDSTNGMRLSQISLEIFSKMPDADVALGTDEALGEELLDDAETILRELRLAAVEDEPVVFHLALPSVVFTEHHDSNQGVQGFVLTFSISY